MLRGAGIHVLNSIAWREAPARNRLPPNWLFASALQVRISSLEDRSLAATLSLRRGKMRADFTRDWHDLFGAGANTVSVTDRSL
jgi:hypothetical protein